MRISVTVGTILLASALTMSCDDHRFMRGAGSGGEGGDDSESGSAATPGQALCAAIGAQLSACGASTPCDTALLNDCSSIVGILNPELIDVVRGCVEAKDASPMGCFMESLGKLSPSDAHTSLASSFCDHCAFGAPGCEMLFFSQDEGGTEAALGAPVLAFSDDVVKEIEETCATGLGCATTFLMCAETVLAGRALPTETAMCLMTSLASGEAPASLGECGKGTSSGGATTGTGMGGAATTSSGPGTATSTGSGPTGCAAQPTWEKCTDCCYGVEGDAYDVFYTLVFSACACSAGLPCFAECGSQCATENYSDSCFACMNGPATDICAINAQGDCILDDTCSPFMTCLDSCDALP